MDRFMRIVIGIWILAGIAAAQELPDVAYVVGG